MCGRYTLTVNQRPELFWLGLQTRDRFNIAPQSEVLVLDDTHEYRLMRWDYSPHWAEPPMHLINARSETLREKPSFRGAKRCVLIADGWYEWQRHDGVKTPWYHHLDGELMYFAGIYGSGSGCAIVTREAHEHLAHVHHRQPVLLEPRALAPWLGGNDLFASAITHSVRCHPVSAEVNRPGNDYPGLVAPLDPRQVPQPHPGESGDLFGA